MPEKVTLAAKFQQEALLPPLVLVPPWVTRAEPATQPESLIVAYVMADWADAKSTSHCEPAVSELINILLPSCPVTVKVPSISKTGTFVVCFWKRSSLPAVVTLKL